MKKFTLSLLAILLILVVWEFLSHIYSPANNKSSAVTPVGKTHQEKQASSQPPERLSGLELDKEQLRQSWPHLTDEEREALASLKHGKTIPLPDDEEASSPTIESTSQQLLDDADYHVLKSKLANQLASEINSDTGFQPTPDDDRSAVQVFEGW